jgi:hypothetical protein
MTNSPPNNGGRKENSEIEALFVHRSHACFRYPIDGPNEIEKAIDDAIERRRGPRPTDSPYSEWLCKLRRNGLIP